MTDLPIGVAFQCNLLPLVFLIQRASVPAREP
jgi:hypothetical protein